MSRQHFYKDKQFDLDLWPCDLKLSWDKLLSRDIIFTKFSIFQAKELKDVDQISLGRSIDRTHFFKMRYSYKISFKIIGTQGYLKLSFARRNATIPWKLKEAIQSRFIHHSVDWMAGTIIDHSITIQCHSVTIPSPFSKIHGFFVYNWSYMHYL